MASGTMSAGLKEELERFKTLFSNSNDQLLREVIRYSLNLIHNRSKTKLDPDHLVAQFKVIPNVLSQYRAAQTTSNNVGTLLSEDSSAPDTSVFMEGLMSEVKSLNLEHKCSSSL